MIQNSSWFRKFHNLHNAIHRGNIHANKSNNIMNSFREKFFFRISIEIQSITHKIHQMKDIHHCRTLNMFQGLFKKY